MKPFGCLLGALCLAVAGCSSAPPPAPPGVKHLETLVTQYNQYAAGHNGKAPPSADAFKKFLAEKKVADADDLFVSPRDKQPYVVKYNVSLQPDYSKGLVPPTDPKASRILIAAEQTGVNGKKMVGYASGVIEEVDQAAPLK